MNNKISVELDKEIKNCLIDFQKGCGPADFSHLLRKYILTYHNLLYRTIKDIKNYFNNNELYCLFDILNNGIYCSDESPKNYILYNLIDALNYEPVLCEKWSINKNVFIEKIESLSDFQAFSIIMLIYKYWREPDRYKDNLSLLFKDTVEKHS